MQSPCRRWTLVFNGEIYNYQDLKQEVEASGKYAHAFRGHSDTEVLLAAFSIWGVVPTLEKAEGMFAFALWDADRKRLCLARDRFGEKPLYYAWSNGTLLFGSEIHALKGYPGATFSVDESSLHSYFRYGYFPTPHTVYKEVRKLTPGYLLEVQESETFDEQPFWKIADHISAARGNPFRGTREDAVDSLDDLLSDAVRLRMISDVPLGAFLSGGIDSSLVVATMQRQSAKPIETFSIGFTEEAYNEAPFAEKVAKHLGTNHEQWIISPREAQEVIPTLGDVYDEPLADASQIPTLLVSTMARKKVTVALSGDAGDELFAGYDRYRWAQSVQKIAGSSPKVVQKAIGKVLGALPNASLEQAFSGLRKYLPADFHFNNPTDKLEKLARVLSSENIDEIYKIVASQWPNPGEVVSAGTERGPSARATAIPHALNDLLSRMMYFDTVTYLCDDVLTKVDRASMNRALEVRVPLLDRKILSLLWSLPPEWKLSDGQTKVLVRGLLKRHFPEKFFDRPKKGFSLPVDVWLKTGLRDWAETLLAETALADSRLFNVSAIRRTWQEHLAGTRNHQHKLWSVLQFQTWWFAQKK